MAPDNFNFQGRGNLSVGKFSTERVRRILDSQFKDMHLPAEARNHFAQELGEGGTITSSEFDSVVNEAHKKGLISSETAEKIKDKVKLPDTFNKHWE